MNHYPRRPLTDDKSRCNDLDEQSPTATKPPGVIAQEIACHATKLMILPIEVGLVDREGVDQMLDFMLDVRPQHGKIGLEGVGSGSGNPFGEPTVDEISLVVVE